MHHDILIRSPCNRPDCRKAAREHRRDQLLTHATVYRYFPDSFWCVVCGDSDVGFSGCFSLTLLGDPPITAEADDGEISILTRKAPCA